ncbi:RIP metalloprotease RseP [Candidatus Uhrbacteria bacterium]|nr:RIP metalloprotease RseP [Candidatus Uhrbacteria bacterium]
MLTFLIFLAVLSLLVFVHEFGHFMAARRLGVEVEEFGFGFPPRLWGIKRGATIFSVNLIPLGGFVKLKGEQGENADQKDSFASQSIARRALIVAAGVLMNFLLAAMLFSIGFVGGLPQEVSELAAGARVEERRLVIGAVAEESPAAKAEFEAGDMILSVDGQTFDAEEVLRDYFQSHEGLALAIEVQRGDQKIVKAVTPEVLPQTGQPGLGVYLVLVGRVSYPWYLAPWRGLETTADLTVSIVRVFGGVLRDLVTRGQIGEDVSGPVGIAVLTGRAAALGFSYLLQLVAVLSINLAVINFLPIPALDGGRFIFLMIERARGKPVSRQAENIIHQVGFVLLLALVILITFRDFFRVFKS